jgi:hypothetical protein
MVGNRSPGINHMSYNCSIHNLRRSMIIGTNSFNLNEMFVVEENNGTRKEWLISRLQKDINSISKHDPIRNSFIRTREWLLQNHPELLL